jgi:hypothetical protein
VLPARPVAPQITQPQQVSPPPANPTPITRPIAPPQPIGAPRHADPHDEGSGGPGGRRDGSGGHAEPASRRPSRDGDPPLDGKDAEFVDWVSGLGGD